MPDDEKFTGGAITGHVRDRLLTFLLNEQQKAEKRLRELEYLIREIEENDE